MNLSNVSTPAADVTSQLFGAEPMHDGRTSATGGGGGDTTLTNISQSTLNFLLHETQQPDSAAAGASVIVQPATPTVTPATPIVTPATPPVLEAADPVTVAPAQPQAPPRPSIATTAAVPTAVAPKAAPPTVAPPSLPPAATTTSDTIIVLDDDSVIELSSDEGICHL